MTESPQRFGDDNGYLIKANARFVPGEAAVHHTRGMTVLPKPSFSTAASSVRLFSTGFGDKTLRARNSSKPNTTTL